MNSRIIKIVGAYLIGAGIGAGIGWLIGDYLEAHIEDEHFVAIDDEPAEPSGSQTGPANYEIESETPAELKSEKPVVMDEKARKSKKNEPKEEPTDYTKFAPMGLEKEPIEEVAKKLLPVPPSEIVSDREPPKKVSDPEVISLEEYSEGKRSNHCLDWTYYSDDDTMADENEDPVPNPQDFLGDDFRENFGVMSEDPDCVYIRNYHNGTDYEVIRLKKKYSVTIAGEPEEVKKPTRSAAKKNGAHRVAPETPSERRARARKEKVEDDDTDAEE